MHYHRSISYTVFTTPQFSFNPRKQQQPLVQADEIHAKTPTTGMEYT